MKKIALLPLAVALAVTAGCSRRVDTGINTAGSPGTGGGLEVNLAEGGLTMGSRGLHHSNIIAFGQPRDQVIMELASVLGRPSISRNADCPSGPVETASFGPLDLHFEGGRFTGWVVDEAGTPQLQSYHGLSVGDRRNEIDGDARVEVDANSSLGTELSVNGIGVLLGGPAPSDRVTTLFSGTTCFAR
jgi:hypothetical protein